MAKRWRRPQVALLALLLAVAVGYTVNALRGNDSPSHPTTSATSSVSTTVALSSLPSQVASTLRLIKSGGPFPYSQDGVVFDNNEHLLPSQPRGYYHEYTVPTPGASDRATRRIVAGASGEYYYTADHYATFHRIDLTS